MLPPELLSLVCGYLPKKDLRNLRLVSSNYEQAAVPYLFDEVFISFNIADLRIAKIVILRFKQFIRTLVFSSACFLKIDRELFDDICGISEDRRHDDLVFQQHTDLYKAQQEILEDGACPAHLAYALSSLSRLQKIILTDWSSSRSMTSKPMQDHQVRHLSSCVDCDLEECDYRGPQMSGFREKGRLNPWRTILLAISTTNAQVTEITDESKNHYSRSMNTAVFKFSPPELHDARLCSAALTKLRLRFNMGIREFTSNGKRYYVHRDFADLLCSAKNLEHLCLEANDRKRKKNGQMSMFHAILGQCKYPKLKSLILLQFYSSDKELLRFLTASPGLEHLTLKDHCLNSGSWGQVAKEMRSSFQLKSTHLEQIFGGFPDPDTLEYTDWYGEVGRFLLFGGENPFTPKAMEKHEADYYSDKARTELDDYSVRCHMFH